MQEAIEQFLNTYNNPILNFFFNFAWIGILSGLVVSFIAFIVVRDNSKLLAVSACVCIACVVVLIPCYCIHYNVDFIISAIETTYNISIEHNKTNQEKLHYDITNTEPSSIYQKEITVRSLNPNDSTNYIVFLVKQNDTWQLCKRNDHGEYIALDPNNTISDLKEN